LRRRRATLSPTRAGLEVACATSDDGMPHAARFKHYAVQIPRVSDITRFRHHAFQTPRVSDTTRFRHHAAQTLNEEPQPQVLDTFGFPNLKPAPIAPST